MTDEDENQIDAAKIALTEELIRFRGSIIASYSQVEFLLADFAMQCARRAELKHLVTRFPYTLESRFRTVLTLLKHDPFRQYRDKAKPLIRALEGWESLRHMMAHGHMMVEFHPGNLHILVFKLYETVDGGGTNLRIFKTDHDNLLRAANDAGRYAENFVALWKRMYLEQRLEVQPF